MRRNNISQQKALPQIIILTVCQIVQQDQGTETTFCLRRDINKLPSINTICDKHGGEKAIWHLEDGKMDCENDDAIFLVTDGKARCLLNGNRQLQRFMKKRWDETWRLNSSHHWRFWIVPLVYNCLLKVIWLSAKCAVKLSHFISFSSNLIINIAIRAVNLTHSFSTINNKKWRKIQIKIHCSTLPLACHSKTAVATENVAFHRFLIWFNFLLS